MHISIPWKTNLHYRFHLSGRECVVYNSLLRGLQDWDDFIALPDGIESHRIMELLVMVLMDVPMFYHVDTQSMKLSRLGEKILYRPRYRIDETTYRKEFVQVKQFLDNAAKNLAARNDFDKLRILHDAIIDHVIYHDTESPNEHNALGAILDRKAVCEGIAKAYKLMCDVNQIPSIVVFGHHSSDMDYAQYSPREKLEDNHAWNLVRLDGRWYQVDVTHDLNRSIGQYTRVKRYDFFLRSDWTFAKFGHISAPWLKLPRCQRNFDLYLRLGLRMKNKEGVQALVCKSVEEKRPATFFEVAPEWNIGKEELNAFVESILSSQYGKVSRSAVLYEEKYRVCLIWLWY